MALLVARIAAECLRVPIKLHRLEICHIYHMSKILRAGSPTCTHCAFRGPAPGITIRGDLIAFGIGNTAGDS